MRKIVSAVLACALSAGASAEIREESISYEAGDTSMQGYLVWDDDVSGQRPGVLVVHEWWGLNDYARHRARMLAEAGYAALAVDMYGNGKNTTHPAEATAFMQAALADAENFKARFVAAKRELEQHPTVDPEHLAAIGYCFGGGTVLNMARQGIDLDLVASFHGLLATETPATTGSVVPRVLVFHGAADASVPAEHVDDFRKEMDAAGADYDITVYPGAQHGFTNPAADAMARKADPSAPPVYDAAADKDSWEKLMAELDKVFAE